MTISIIPDANKYLLRLAEMIRDNGMVVDPKELFNFIRLYKSKNRVIAWQIIDKEILLATNDKLDCDEKGNI